MEERRRGGFPEVRYYSPPAAGYYYLVAGTSGCPSAEFRWPGALGGGGALVVWRVRSDSAGPFLPVPVPPSAPELPEQDAGKR